MTRKTSILLTVFCAILVLLLLTVLALLLFRQQPAAQTAAATTAAPAALQQIPAYPPPAAASERSTVPEPSETEAPPAWTQTLPAQLAAMLPDNGDVWVVYVELLSTGETAQALQGAALEDPLISASIVKLFVMAAVFDRIERGELTYEAVEEDLRLMITISDNDAANRMIRLLGNGDAEAGEQAVNAYAQSIGCTQVRLNRLMLEQNGTENYVSAADCALLLRMIYNGTCVSAAASARMMDLLLAQHYRDYIPAQLPKEVPVAHKGGDLSVMQGDVGIVFAETGPYIVCIVENGSWSDDNTARIGAISRCVYDVLNPNSSDYTDLP